MASVVVPLSFLTVDPPKSLSYGPPAVDSTLDRQSPQRLPAGPAIRLPASFTDHVCSLDPQGAQALQQAGVSPSSLYGLLAGAQGRQAGVSQTAAAIAQAASAGVRRGGTAGQQAQSVGSDAVFAGDCRGGNNRRARHRIHHDWPGHPQRRSRLWALSGHGGQHSLVD